MAKMTMPAIKALYESGKQVYEKEIDIDSAVDRFLEQYSDSVSKTSAIFYIGLYSDYMIGKGSTWNQNSDLVLYYVEHITEEQGIQTGKNAYKAAMKFAQSKGKQALIKDLEELWKKYDSSNESGENGETDKSDNAWRPLLSEYDPGISKEKWMELLPKLAGPVWGGVLAMFYTEKEGATCAEIARKYDLTPSQIIGRCVQLSKRVYKETNCTLVESDEGNTYWPILFFGKSVPSSDREKGKGIFSWKLRPELYGALTEFDILRFLPKEENDGYEELEFNLTPKEAVDHIKTYISAKGFSYSGNLIENFYLSVKSKPFTILAGTSGTGKTRLVKLFAEAIGANVDNGRYKMIPVRPDWSDSSDLFGHLDLNGKYVTGEVLEFIANAQNDPNKPYILCLDEMNLARVEYYLSDFLSVIETREISDGKIVSDPLVTLEKYGTDADTRNKFGEIRFPQNLYLVGTVNMDETTFPFSKKVLDRANTIEFDYVDLNSIQNTDVQDVKPITAPNEFLKSKYLFLQPCLIEDPETVGAICAELQDINKVLQEANAHVGYRVRDEIVFYMMNNEETKLLDRNEAMDNEIMQKILPRIQGSSVSVKKMLCELFKRFAGDFDGYQTKNGDIASKMDAKLDELKKSGKKIKYLKSARKVAFMVRRFEEDGFTSYWL